MAVIAEKGPEASSIEDFVAAAGVSRGTFYNYFPAVGDLLDALNNHLAVEFDRRLGVAAEGVDDPALVLALIVHESFRIVATDPLEGWVAMRIERSSRPRQALVAARFDAIFQWAVGRGRFRPVNPDAARNLIFGAVRMAQAEVISASADPAHAIDLVSLILIAYGLTAAEADEISQAAVERLSDR